MESFHVSASVLSGELTIPTSKSHTLRAILFASLATGESHIHHYLASPDAVAMIDACRALGAQIHITPDCLTIQGVSGSPCVPDDVINAGNSGQVLRFIGAIAGLIDGYTIITGDESVRHNRPVQPLLDGLQQLTAFAKSARGDGLSPIIIRGPMTSGTLTVLGLDSQPVSGLLIASVFLEGTTTINVLEAGEKPWVDLTLRWLDRLGVVYQRDGYDCYRVSGKKSYAGFDYTVPGDFSSLAFPVVAALLTGSSLRISPVDMSDSQGDKKLFAVLSSMGAQLDYDESTLCLKVLPCQQLVGREIAINDFVDAITILAVVGCFASGETRITGAAIARQKECNRLKAICTELKKMGADIAETDDGLIIKQSSLHAATVESYHDHRMAMSLSVAALLCEGETVINDVACVKKSFPHYARIMANAGMNIQVCQ
jgi:3-phosphoshikimate 1-carboxyvinyltransferase